MRGFIAPKNRGIDYWLTREFSYMPFLFTPRSEGGYSLIAIIHVFMNRLSQSYEEVLKMPSDDRDAIFELELRVIEQEQKDSENK